MCNQCEDIRRIHGRLPVWIVLVNGTRAMQAKTKYEAERIVKVLSSSRPDDVFDIVEDNSYFTKWEA
jgi:hypothetical protein